MIEPIGIPVDLKILITFAGVMVPICIWFSKHLTKVHKKIHKRLDVIEDQVVKIHTRLDNIEFEIENLLPEEIIKKARLK